MNNIFIITTYTLGWLIVLGMTFLVISSLLQYISTGLKSTKVLIGLVTVVALWLAAVISLILAQAHTINLEKTGGLVLLFLDSFVIQVINQWTNPNTLKRMQRTLRWVITGTTIILGLIVIGFFIYGRS